MILDQFDLLWSMFEKRFDTKPIVADVCVVETESTECPPAPTCRYLQKAISMVADADNFGVADFDNGRTRMVVSTAAVRYPLYLRQFFLECAAGGHIATLHVTPVHAGCVVLEGRGVLLCGDSGAGKSSLSYACARAGWGYVSDDASFLLNGGSKRIVIGDCHKVRFRPSAAELFPEIAGMEITPRAEGKPSIVVPTATMPHVTRRESAHVDYVVFLNRHADAPPQLVPYRKDVARHYMHQVLYGWPESLAAQHAAIDRLLAVEVFEMRYCCIDWAVERLQQLVREGR
ncbi:MAG: aldolase [Acidobacteriaceae bacterium]